jgi:hypothetical protein
MMVLIFALSQNGARRNYVFNCFPFSSANPTFIIYRLQTAYVFFYKNIHLHRPLFALSNLSSTMDCSEALATTFGAFLSQSELINI